MQIGRKAPPPFLPFGEILDSYRSTWHNFTHRYFMHHWTSLWFLWQKSPPPQDEGKFFDLRFIRFRQFRATLVFVAEKPPPSPPRMREKFLTSDLSVSGNFEQLWFLWQKSPPPGWGKNFWPQIYPFQAILSNFGFCGRKAPPPTTQVSMSILFDDIWHSRTKETSHINVPLECDGHCSKYNYISITDKKR